MKSGSLRSDQKAELETCLMCGATTGDTWQTRPTRFVVLQKRPRPGDTTHLCILCNECEEGLRGLKRGYTCQMCGVAAGDPDPLGGSRTVRLTIGHIKDKSLVGDDSRQNLRAVCTNCNEGLQNTAPPKPDRLHLLSQVRRATIDDQQAVLDWLLQKFKFSVHKSD